MMAEIMQATAANFERRTAPSARRRAQAALCFTAFLTGQGVLSGHIPHVWHSHVDGLTSPTAAFLLLAYVIVFGSLAALTLRRRDA